MKFINYTPFSPMTFESLDKFDNPFQVVILRGSFRILPDAPLRPIPEQAPVVVADQYYDEINTSSIRFDSDLAPFKPRSDIVINASAWSPGMKPSTHWRVEAQVGKLSKRLVVSGPRFWRNGLLGGWKISDPIKCVEVPLRYEYAYGGQWRHKDKNGVCQENPVGVGYINLKHQDKNDMIPAPRIMSADKPVMRIGQIHKPEGFSAITRSWLPRRSYAGTFDEKWVKERHPYLPRDFDYAYNNCAHPDMIYDGYLKGDEDVVLKAMHRNHAILRFSLPGYKIGLLLRYVDGSMEIGKVALDTAHFEVSEERAYLVWRGQFTITKPLNVIEARMTMPGSTT